MRNITLIEYLINLITLLIFYMYMFQLNSYTFSKQVNWMKVNIKKIIMQIIVIVFSFVLLKFNIKALTVISIIILGISIIYNFPKGKKKIEFKNTNRVKRMFITQIIICTLIILIGGYKFFIIEKLVVLNILAVFMCIVANVINKPIEKIRKRKYINDAKKILKETPNLIVIGVTGSYGKTSVKNFLMKALSTKYEVLITPKNYNTTMGVVKTIRENLKATHQIFICEMGANRQGEIKEICDIVKPKIAIITSIGPQHLETFKNIDNIIKTKFELLEAVKEQNGTAFLNYDNKYLKEAVKPKMEIITYGINNDKLECNGYNANSSHDGITFDIRSKENKTIEEVRFKSKLIGKHNITNIVGVIAISKYLNIETKKLVPVIRDLKSVEHRLQVHNHGKITIIDDSYNSNPISSKSALDTLNEFEGKKIIVTPGLIELGQDEKKYNFEFGKYMSNICDYIFLVGSTYSKPIMEGILSTKYNRENIFVVNTPNEAVKKIEKMNINEKVNILLENDLPDNYNL